MNKVFLLSIVSSAFLLTACVSTTGTSTEFECNATTSDSCMTMEQANEMAKRMEERAAVKPAVGRLQSQTKNDFFNSRSLRNNDNKKTSLFLNKPSVRFVSTSSTGKVVTKTTYNDPLRRIDRIGRLWIAPYIDTEDLYHQPGFIEFVITPSSWEQPRIY